MWTLLKALGALQLSDIVLEAFAYKTWRLEGSLQIIGLGHPDGVGVGGYESQNTVNQPVRPARLVPVKCFYCEEASLFNSWFYYQSISK